MISVAPKKLNRYANKKQVTIMGCGSWGSVIARIIARNVIILKRFHPKVKIYVHDENINNKKLSDVINEEHENVKYAPGYKFTKNLIAVPDLIEAAETADILIFVIPNQFIQNMCRTLVGSIKPTAVAVSLIKGFEVKPGGVVCLISQVISKMLHIPCYVLMGANIAMDVAAEERVCRTTLGCSHRTWGKWLKELFETDYLKITVVDDENTVEVCGALKNVVALAVGFIDAMDKIEAYKEATIRLGFMEMVKFVDLFYPGGKLSTFFESCGIEDLLVSSYGGRNSLCAKAFAKSGKSFEVLEKELLKGQKLQGPSTAAQVNKTLTGHKMLHEFPFLTLIHQICIQEKPVEEIVEYIEKNMSKHTYVPVDIII